MITEDYCSFELSKLLKEKGFNIPSNYAWHGGIKEPDFHRHSRNFNGGEYKDLRTKWYSAPTHQMAMKWLRNNHKVEICIFPIDDNEKKYQSRILKWFGDCLCSSETFLKNTYEEAVEAALKYCLTELI